MDLDLNNIVPEMHYYIHRRPTPNWEITPWNIPFIDLTYVVKGKAMYTIGKNEYLVQKGDLICIPRNTYRAASTIPEDLIESYAANIMVYNLKGEHIALPLPLISHIGIVPHLVSQFHEIHDYWLGKEFGYMLKIRELLCSILYEALSLILNKNQPTYKDSRIKSSIQFLNQHYSEAITLSTLAEQFHLNPVYYGSLFQKEMKMTFKQYLTLLRLNNAENMLKSGEYTVSEVALQCGFSDVFYFSKIFKEKRGVSPSRLFPTGREKP